MAKNPAPGGKEKLSSVLDQLRSLDPKVITFDSPEVEDLERSVIEAVKELFGEGSPEDERFQEFKVYLGHFSLQDSAADKQMKYELGIPQAISQVEELLDAAPSLVDLDEVVEEIQPEDIVPEPAKQAPTAEPKPEKAARKAAPKAAVKPAAKPAKKSAAPPTEEAAKEAEAPPAAKPAAARPSTARQGKVILLRAGDEEMALSVAALLDKLALDTEMPDEESGQDIFMDRIQNLKGAAFALVILSPDDKGVIPGLTAMISKSRPRQDVVFELGFLVGKLGRGNVAVLYAKDRAMEIPTDLYGVEYLPYQPDGGWQINLVKMLKSAGYDVDANVLFE